ncbi:hypothetical protein SAMN05444408_11095 [Chryseobacterium takakiae]|uniref:Uncharacterized protein n=1 Tax=Chryseobacterium takakiae TaxID=1302685 RepID=A0A1M4ZKZ0_9FLAO|nr:hypothetical protein SAMN05444408_11095 [Chryseobacterium takakiae]
MKISFIIEGIRIIFIFNIAVMPEYLTNFNSKMALIVLINASIY